MTQNNPTTTYFTAGMYFAFKIIPALSAVFSIYLGYRLFVLGVTGQASLSLESRTISGQLLNAAPGLFFALGGIAVLVAVVWRSVNITLYDSGAIKTTSGVQSGQKKTKKGPGALGETILHAAAKEHGLGTPILSAAADAPVPKAKAPATNIAPKDLP